VVQRELETTDNAGRMFVDEEAAPIEEVGD
jgi:hypothetical protein